MDISSIARLNTSPTSATAAETTQAAAATSKNQTLDQSDFLKLLVTQLTTQNPLSPQTDTEFVAQLAQFSSLEQSKTMVSDVSQLRTEQQFTSANALLGRAVGLQDGTSGYVSAVQVEAGTPKILVNGQTYELGQVQSVIMAETIK